MISKRGKCIATAFAILLLFGTVLLGAAFAGGRTEDAAHLAKESYIGSESLKGLTVGGVSVSMSDDAVKLFLEGYFGTEIGDYRSFDSMEDAVEALRNGRISAIWAADVTADYLTEDGEFISISAEETPGSTGWPKEERFAFSFAFRKEDEALREKADAFVENSLAAKAKGTTEEGLREAPGNPQRQWVRSFDRHDPLYIGLTGAVPPLETIEEYVVYGIAVDFAAKFALEIDKLPVFVALPAKTAYADLLAGKVDMLAVSATGENHSLTTPKYITSKGYLGVKEYQIIARREPVKDMGILAAIKENLIAGGAYREILAAAKVTIQITVLSWILAALFGYGLYYLCGCKNKVLRGMGSGIAYIFRSVPALLLVLLLGAGLFGGSRAATLIPATFGISLYGAGLLTEHLCGISADRGNRAFIRTLGTRAVRRIAVSILQWTTVVGCLGVRDLSAVMQEIGNRTMYPLFAIAFAIAFYLVATLVLDLLPATDVAENTAARIDC